MTSATCPFNELNPAALPKTIVEFVKLELNTEFAELLICVPFKKKELEAPTDLLTPIKAPLKPVVGTEFTGEVNSELLFARTWNCAAAFIDLCNQNPELNAPTQKIPANVPVWALPVVTTNKDMSWDSIEGIKGPFNKSSDPSKLITGRLFKTFDVKRVGLVDAVVCVKLCPFPLWSFHCDTELETAVTPASPLNHKVELEIVVAVNIRTALIPPCKHALLVFTRQ